MCHAVSELSSDWAALFCICPGVFAVPLDQLVDRAGSDSVLGATAAHLKVPTFLEDIIAAMKQMGQS